jgi:O-antigen/teichoic acid export membrane protein
LKLPAQAYLLVLAHFLANAFWIHVQMGMQGAKLMRLQGSFLTLERLLVLLIVGVCVIMQQASFLTVALAYIFAPLGASLSGLWVLRRLILPVSGIDRELLKRMLKFSIPILPASLIGYMSSNYLDAFFISHYLTSAHLGVYSVVYLISGTSLQLPLLVGSVLIPLFITLEVGGSEERAQRFMLNTLPLLTLLWGTACIFVAAIGVYVFPRIFGDQFTEMGPLLWPLMAAAAVSGPVLMGYAPIYSLQSRHLCANAGSDWRFSCECDLEFSARSHLWPERLCLGYHCSVCCASDNHHLFSALAFAAKANLDLAGVDSAGGRCSVRPFLFRARSVSCHAAVNFAACAAAPTVTACGP